MRLDRPSTAGDIVAGRLTYSRRLRMTGTSSLEDVGERCG